jgi:hypothetical protein
MKTKSFDRSNAVITAFVRAYIEAALWSTTDNTTEQGGEPLDKNYDMSCLSDECMEKCITDCWKFETENLIALSKAGTDEQNGHDFWLTRNYHGCGFWDRDYDKEIGKALTDSAHEYGEVDLYVGDDEMIHCM